MITWALFTKSPNCASHTTRSRPQRNVEVLPISLLGLIVPNVLPMTKGSASHVQAGEPHVEAVREKRRIGEVLGKTPVDRPVLAARDASPVLQHPFNAGMQREARRHGGEPTQHHLQAVYGNRGCD